MIEKITIENYKSIQKLEIELGRITVLIGANGSGKSNILEAIALSSAATNNKLDNEFLVSRGIRVTDDPRFMRSAFTNKNVDRDIRIFIEGRNLESESAEYLPVETILQKDNEDPYSSWIDNGIKPVEERDIDKFFEQFRNINIQKLPNNTDPPLSDDDVERLSKMIARYLVNKSVKPLDLEEFLIYSPEIYSLRTFEEEGQIQPLGRNGEGLFKLLKVLNSRKNKKRFEEIKSKLKLLDWFRDFDIAKDLSPQEKRIQIKDKYLDKNLEYFDQKSSNEGFLFLLFYLCLFVSSDTPSFFAIDNIDVSLNPKLCSQLIIELSNLAEKYEKQAIFTTHSPAILDGLNLNDENQRLYVVSRNKLGQTKVNRIKKPQSINGKEPVKLSEAFLRGYLGGLPNNF